MEANCSSTCQLSYCGHELNDHTPASAASRCIVPQLHRRSRVLLHGCRLPAFRRIYKKEWRLLWSLRGPGRRIAWMRHGRPTTHSSQSCFLREFARGRRPARRVDGRKSTRHLRRFVPASTHPDERPDAVERNADAALGKRVDPRSSVRVIAVIERSVDIEEHARDRRFDYFCSGMRMLIAPDPSAAISRLSIAMRLWMTGIVCFANAKSLLSEPSAASA
jgi:hypothetical protein